MKFITESDAITQFNDYIDDLHSPIIILGMSYCASTVLEETDPIAYRCEMDNWLDANDLTTHLDDAEVNSQ